MATEEKSLEPGLTPAAEGKEPSLEEKVDEKPADFTSLQKIIASQNELLLSLTKKIDSMETRQDVSDSAIISVAKRVGEGGGGGGLLAQILPFLRQSGPSPFERIANDMFVKSLTFSGLVTDRMARDLFKDEYDKALTDMRKSLAGASEA